MSINNRCKNIFNKKSVTIFIFLIIYILLNLHVTLEADDNIYKDAFKIYGIRGWIDYYANTWSGRIIPNIFLIWLLNMDTIVFNIINAFFLSFLSVVLFKIYNRNKIVTWKNIYLLIFFSMNVFLLPQKVIDNAVFWKAAAVSYLWGTVFALFAILPFVNRFYGRKTQVWEWILACFAVIYCSNYEQAALFACAFSLFMFIYNGIIYKHIIIKEIIIIIMLIVSTIFFLSMPGNYARYNAEILGHNSQYASFTLIEKIMLSVNHGLKFLFENCLWLLLIISLMVIVICAKKMSSIWSKIMIYLPFVYYIGGIITKYSSIYATKSKLKYYLPLKIDKYLYDYITVDGSSVKILISQYLSTIFGLFIILLLGLIILFYTGKENHWNPITALFVFGGFFEIVIMGFSPTLYASGARSGYITMLFFYIAVGALSYDIIDKLKISYE